MGRTAVRDHLGSPKRHGEAGKVPVGRLTEQARPALTLERDAARMLSEVTGPRAWLTPKQGQQFSAEYLRRPRAVETTMPLTFIAQMDLTRL
jgi:hypothetical protein